MARILFLTELLPYPLVSGAKIRAYYVLRHLASQHTVTLLSFVRPDDRPEDVDHLRGFLDQVITVPMQRSLPRNLRAALLGPLTGRPAIIVREEIAEMRTRVLDLLTSASFDVIHADQIPMAQYALEGQGERPRLILDQHNATFKLFERLARTDPNRAKRLFFKREARAFARYEVNVCDRFDRVSFVTQVDRELLVTKASSRGIDLGEKTTVIPICVDTSLVKPVEVVPQPFRVTHVGTMFWPPNVEGILWFWRTVWPRVRELFPQARLTLIGKNPPETIRALGEHPDVEVHGYVEDLDPYLAETAVFVVPLHAAGGMRVKIIDAWCWGLCTVSTPIGAEGIDIRDGENILIAGSADAFAQAVSQALDDKALRDRIRMGGRRWVEERYDWQRVYPVWDEVYGRLLET